MEHNETTEHKEKINHHIQAVDEHRVAEFQQHIAPIAQHQVNVKNNCQQGRNAPDWGQVAEIGWGVDSGHI